MQNSLVRRRIARSVLSVAAAAALMVPAAGAHAADIQPYGVCGDTFNPSVTGGKASWTLSCSGNNITIAGWVEDTKADGKCARVTAYFSNSETTTWKACPAGTRTNFSATKPGSLIDAYLTVTE